MKQTTLKPKFKVGDRVVVDKFEDAKIAKVGAFRKNGRKFIAYQLTENILPGFWAEEDRIKKHE